VSHPLHSQAEARWTEVGRAVRSSFGERTQENRIRAKSREPALARHPQVLRPLDLRACKDNCMYNEPVPLLNVRLSADDARLVRALRARGVAISDLVRRAIRAEAAAVSTPSDTDEVLRTMIARFPMVERPAVRSSDRHELRAAVRKRLGRKR
jgi:post-segregation antitoxin (ccd killing protein)